VVHQHLRGGRLCKNSGRVLEKTGATSQKNEEKCPNTEISQNVKVKLHYIHPIEWIGATLGKLIRIFTRHQFTVCEEKFLSSDESGKVDISCSRSCHRKLPLTGGQGLKNCNCLKRCFTKSAWAKYLGGYAIPNVIITHHALIFISLYKVFIFCFE
jgi:hypothetical protein